MALNENVSLKSFNTFGVEARARYFWGVTAAERLPDALARLAPGLPLLVLGGGSNILFTRNFEGLVLKNSITGMAVLEDGRDQVKVRAGGGEDWHGFVRWCLRQGFYGLENLSLIPGTVGAAPVQNIGAYGVEVGERIAAVETIDLETGEPRCFEAAACDFAYRSSRFKARRPGRYFITAVVFRLSRKPRLVTAYADVRQALAQSGASAVSPRQLSDMVCAIRRRKLPDPQDVANAGSFFKNPIVSGRRFRTLVEHFPDLPAHSLADGSFKLAAAWMIEKCGWKGRRVGACGVYPRHSLVLVNYGGASGGEILDLAEAVQSSVEAAFGLRLEPEPLIL